MARATIANDFKLKTAILFLAFETSGESKSKQVREDQIVKSRRSDWGKAREWLRWGNERGSNGNCLDSYDGRHRCELIRVDPGE